MTVAVNPLRGEALLVAGSGTFKLVLDVNAFCLVEAALDLTTLEIADKLERNAASLTEMRALLWAAFAKEHERSIVEVGDVISTAGLVATRQALAEALAAAFGVTAGGKKAASPRKRGAATG